MSERPRKGARWIWISVVAVLLLIVGSFALVVRRGTRQAKLNDVLRQRGYSFDTRQVVSTDWEQWLYKRMNCLYFQSIGIASNRFPEVEDDDDEDMPLIAELFSLTTGNPGAPATCRLVLQPSDVSDVGLSYLTQVPQLHELTLESPNVTDVGLQQLGKMKNLRRLRLYHLRMTDAGAAELAGLTRLEHLELLDMPLTDETLKQLAGLVHLKVLYLDRTHVTDAGLQYLSRLPRLQILSLRQTRITSVGLSQLKNFPALKTIYAPDSPYQKKKPTIEDRLYLRLGHWRTQPLPRDPAPKNPEKQVDGSQAEED